MSDFSNVINAVAVCVQARVPCLLMGPPGDAKTRIVECLMEQTTVDYETSIVAIHDPTDYGGYPVPLPAEGMVRMLPTAWSKRLAEKSEGGTRRVGLMLDELTNGAPATRSAAMRGILDGVWGEQVVPNLSTVAAANPPDIAESGYDLSAPLANRFCHINWDMPPDYWIEALISGFPSPTVVQVPEKREKELVKATTMVAAFAHARPGSMKSMPKDASARSGPWPSYRSWTMARQLVAACLAVGYDLEHNVTVLLVSGCVGDGAAHEFLTYSKELDLPNPEIVLADPGKLVLPKRGDRAFAVLTSVITAVLANNTEDRWLRAWKVLQKAVEADRVDVAAGAARALARNKPKGSTADAPKEVSAFVPILKEAGLMGSVS